MHKYLHFLITGIFLVICFSVAAASKLDLSKNDPELVFQNPPASASPGVLWMWMGSNISREGITKDLEALKKAGFNRTTLFSLSDVTTPWAGEIQNSPTPQIVAWTEPWWEMIRFAAIESKRLGMDFGMFHCPGYEASGGKWITPELSMQELCWSESRVSGNQNIAVVLKRPVVNIHANMPWPVFNPETGRVEKPQIAARDTFYRDIAVLAAPSNGLLTTSSVINLTDKMATDGKINWKVPSGDWIIYRIGYTTTGAIIQPAQWAATGLECDKMNPEAVAYHMDYVIGEVKKHLGKLAGKGFSHLHFDSYEAGVPTWTPRMREEFTKRRNYDPLPYLLTFAGRNVGGKTDSLRFRNDFQRTIKDLYRDVYFKTIRLKLKKAHLGFLCEPYGGPWELNEVMPLVGTVMTEFWTNNGKFTPYELNQTVAALRMSGQNIVEAEAFTGSPSDSKWNETPAWLKPIGDAAFCAGVNRLVLHRFTHQPFADVYKPGMTMGQWGTHFDRTQTWWNEMPELVRYWKRCQALLQWGKYSANTVVTCIKNGQPQLQSISRSNGKTQLFFLANTSHNDGEALCTFPVNDLQPELWNPVTGDMQEITNFEQMNDSVRFTVQFADAQSYFVVFRKKLSNCVQSIKKGNVSVRTILTISSPWKVQFDSAWGGPAKPVVFDRLIDWTQSPEPGIKYYSGTAVYTTEFDLQNDAEKYKLILSTGKVNGVARVKLNGVDIGCLWTAPWEISVPDGILKPVDNILKIAVTNVWANRLIGDKQYEDDCEWLPGYQGGRFLKKFPEWFLKNEPRPAKERYCFTTWDYFSKNSALVNSGLTGPVQILSVTY